MSNPIVLNVFNQKAFSSKLNGVVTSAKNIKSKIQELLIDALENQAKETGNLGALTDLLLKTKAVKSINSKQLEKVVFHYAAGIEWNTKKNKKGEKVTSLRIKKGQTLDITIPTVNWADFEKDSAESVVTGYNKVSDESRAKLKDKAFEKALVSSDEALESRYAVLRQEMKVIQEEIAEREAKATQAA